MRGWRRLLRRRSATVGLAVLAIVAVVSIFGTVIAPHDPLAQDVNNILAGPSALHWLGTDYLGRDTMSRLLVGTRMTLIGAVEAVGVAVGIGVVPGMASAFVGPRVEFVLRRCVEAIMTIPFIVLAIAVIGVLGNDQTVAMLAIGVAFAPRFFRITRAVTLALARTQYVEASQLLGAGRVRVLRTHVLAKVVPTLAVTTANALAGSILAVSALSFLGLGVQEPAPTWGGMLAADLNYLTVSWWSPLIPGVAIMATVGALNALADAIRDATTSAGIYRAVPVDTPIPSAEPGEADAA